MALGLARSFCHLGVRSFPAGCDQWAFWPRPRQSERTRPSRCDEPAPHLRRRDPGPGLRRRGGRAGPALSDADRAAIRDIIGRQVEAFRRDDGDAAFGFASPIDPGMFGTSDIFMDMVRQGYQPVYRPRVFDFREIVELHGQVTQKVHVDRPRRTAGHRLLSDDAAARRQLAHRRLLPAGAGRTPGLIRQSVNRVSPKVLALLARAHARVGHQLAAVHHRAATSCRCSTFRTIVLGTAIVVLGHHARCAARASPCPRASGRP